MKANVGSLDRMIRVAMGFALLALPVLLASDARWLGLIGAIPLVTGVVRWCPLYALLGLNTCPPTEEGLPTSSSACG